uniref:Uncharacterized protein n=1 Tax=Arundo donax TaxID=35708 RepID=A0A0A9E8E9_ARUDO
MVSARLIV